MRQGSRIHKTLEEEIHEVVPVRVISKEDRFGLRILNIVQGLRTLRATGITRELEVWGIVDGLVVNGIIDEITYTCPDVVLDASVEESKNQAASGALPKSQLRIEPVSQLRARGCGNDEQAVGLYPALRSRSQRIVYLSDCKTRGAKRLPAGASLRPTWMQLMMYRKLLESLAFNSVDAVTVLDRYDVRPLEPFSDDFITEVESWARADEGDRNGAPLDLSSSELRKYGNLSALWSLMITEFQQSIDGVSDMLRAEFRWTRTSEVIGSAITIFDANVIENYISDEISWWKGQRGTKGVEIEEAFKCRLCDFAEGCTWRKAKVEEAMAKSRLRAASKQKAAV
jgi:exonuclease V